MNMTRYDKIRERRLKIKDLLSRYGALSSLQLCKLVNDEGFSVNHRTVQRDIEELLINGEVKANPPVGREQTYSLAKTEKPVEKLAFSIPKNLINEYLKFCKEVVAENIYGNPFRAWDLVENFAATTPIKEKFKPYLDAAQKKFNEEMEFADPHEKFIFVKRIIVPFLLDKFCSLLFQVEAAENE